MGGITFFRHQSKSRQDKSVQRAPEATKTEKAGVEKRKSLPIQHAIQENIAAANREDEKETEMFDTVVGVLFCFYIFQAMFF